MVPALVFLVPPPEREAVNLASRTRQQLLASWQACVQLLKKNARRFLSEYMKSNKKNDVSTKHQGCFSLLNWG